MSSTLIAGTIPAVHAFVAFHVKVPNNSLLVPSIIALGLAAGAAIDLTFAAPRGFVAVAWSIIIVPVSCAVALITLQLVQPTVSVSFPYWRFAASLAWFALLFKTGASYCMARDCNAQSWQTVVHELKWSPPPS